MFPARSGFQLRVIVRDARPDAAVDKGFYPVPVFGLRIVDSKVHMSILEIERTVKYVSKPSGLTYPAGAGAGSDLASAPCSSGGLPRDRIRTAVRMQTGMP